MDKDSLKKYIYDGFNKDVLPSFQDYIRIPNLSPAYDKEWKTNGTLLKAAQHIQEFAISQGSYFNAHLLENSTPLVYIYVPATNETIKESVLLYGHYDKQPWGDGWDSDKKPTDPKIENGRLYGRGSADDGYSAYAFILAIKAIRDLNGSHPNIHIIIEGCEESGSPDMDDYLKLLSVYNFNFRKLLVFLI
jgi:acetylornithine deacetylase/succinyl-diaminopimelate desuccinylase-like protein